MLYCYSVQSKKETSTMFGMEAPHLTHHSLTRSLHFTYVCLPFVTISKVQGPTVWRVAGTVRDVGVTAAYNKINLNKDDIFHIKKRKEGGKKPGI